MSSALTNIYRSFVNTFVYLWTIVLSWCSLRRDVVVVDLEKGIQQGQSQPLPTPASSQVSSESPGKTSFSPEYAASPFRSTAYHPTAHRTPALKSSLHIDLDTSVIDITVEGPTVPTSSLVEDSMSASGETKYSVSAPCGTPGKSALFIPRKNDSSPCRSSISTSTSTPSFHVSSTSFQIFRDDQNLGSYSPDFSVRPLSPLVFPSRAKGHKRMALATITNISHVMGPSSPVIETFTIPKPSSATPLMAPMGHQSSPLTSSSLVCGVHKASLTPRHTPSVPSTPTIPGTGVVRSLLTHARSLRRVQASGNLHSFSPTRKSYKVSPPASPNNKRPISSVVWFKDPSVTPTTPLRISKRSSTSSYSLPTTQVHRKAGATEEELEKEVLAVQKAFAMIRHDDEDDDGVDARERFNRASVWTTRTNGSTVFDKHMRIMLDEEEDDSDDGYGEELPPSSLTMRSPPPPYLLSPGPPAVYKADKVVYKVTPEDSLLSLSDSTELPYLRSPTAFSSLDEDLDDLLLSFEELIATMPSRLQTPEGMRHGLIGKAKKREVDSQRTKGRGEIRCLA